MAANSTILLRRNLISSLASETFLQILKKELGITSFREVKSPEELLPFKDIMGEKVYNRCKYVVQEIIRTQEASKYLQENNLIEFGKLMFKTHEGLSKLYEVSCKELDFLVEQAKANYNVIGARMMGGGFGGCTINIIRKEGEKDFLATANAAYKKEFNIEAEIIEVEIGDGTHEMVIAQ